MNKQRVAIIPAAGRGTRMHSLTERFPKSLVPVERKPIIAHQLDYLKKMGYQMAVIIINWQGEMIREFTTEYLKQHKFDDFKVTFAQQNNFNGLGAAILTALDHLKSNFPHEWPGFSNALVLLGDTLTTDDLTLHHDQSFVYYKEVEAGTQERWCLVRTEGREVNAFLDKPALESIDVQNEVQALVGVYNFTESEKLYRCAAQVVNEDIRIRGEIQLSTIMEAYLKEAPISAYEIDDWRDYGDLSSYTAAIKNRARNFNHITITDQNTIIKSSRNIKKLDQEINWYLQLDQRLHRYVPKLVDYVPGKHYELDYIRHEWIAEKFVFHNNDPSYWTLLFDRIFDMVDDFEQASSAKHTNESCQNQLRDMTLGKVMRRKAELQKHMDLTDTRTKPEDREHQARFRRIYEAPELRINGTWIKAPTMQELTRQFDLIFEAKDCSRYFRIIHGDLFFGNMFYQPKSGDLKLIDPRGNFGTDGIYGDARYDMAKLCHSVIGKYDYIIFDMFYLIKVEEETVDFELMTGNFNPAIEEMFLRKMKSHGIREDQVYFITTCLFLSMLPLHTDNYERTLMLYLQALLFYQKLSPKN